MRIAVEATCWHNRRGYGRHARALLSALVAESQYDYTFITDGDARQIELPRRVDVVSVDSGTPSSEALRAGGRRTLPAMWRMSRALSRPGFDAVLFPSIFSYVPVFSGAAKVVFQHDVIAETYPHLTTSSLAERCSWNLKCSTARWQATRLVTVSTYSRRLIAERLGWPESRIGVVGEAAAPVFRRVPDPALTPRLATAKIDWSRPVAVYVGGFSPHKNLDRLLDAFRSIASRTGLQLAMVGETDNEKFTSCLAELRQACAAPALAGRVVFTGYLPDEDLAVLLNRASMLVLPSLMEGFGLPAIEAAACGCPVIATHNSPLPELLAQGGTYIDPSDTGQIADAMLRLAEDGNLRQSMSAAGIQAAAALNWSHHARALLEVIKDACQGSAAPGTEAAGRIGGV